MPPQLSSHLIGSMLLIGLVLFLLIMALIDAWDNN